MGLPVTVWCRRSYPIEYQNKPTGKLCNFMKIICGQCSKNVGYEEIGERTPNDFSNEFVRICPYRLSIWQALKVCPSTTSRVSRCSDCGLGRLTILPSYISRAQNIVPDYHQSLPSTLYQKQTENRLQAVSPGPESARKDKVGQRT